MKAKKVLAAVLAIALTTHFSEVMADAYTLLLAIEPASEASQLLRIDGGMPQVRGLYNPLFERAINERISATYLYFEVRAAATDAISLEYDFEHIIDGYNHYIIIYASIASTVESTEVAVIGFNTAQQDFLNLEAFLGPNAITLAEGYITAHMRANPGLFNSEFRGLLASPEAPARFYTQGERVFFLFNQSEIAPGRLGVTRLELDSSRVANVSFAPGSYITMTEFNVKMLPLRTAAEALGFALEWDDATSSISITRGLPNSSASRLSVRLWLEQNSYEIEGLAAPLELEAAPTLINGSAYVPISFFETVLGAIYSTDEYDTITLTLLTSRS